jgi:hypothetical protein
VFVVVAGLVGKQQPCSETGGAEHAICMRGPLLHAAPMQCGAQA